MKLSDTLLSILAVRGGEIVEPIPGRILREGVINLLMEIVYGWREAPSRGEV
jgi:hypothetical protein